MSGITEKLWTNFDEYFGRVGCVTSDKRLDFGVDADHEADPGIL